MTHARGAIVETFQVGCAEHALSDV
jgi:hypothetical protein